MTRTRGAFALVLHTHLPWLSHHGKWPVGEEWLHQAWAGSYDPLFAMFDRWAQRGREHQLTLGVTPILLAMLDDPYSLAAQHTWLGYWQTRAQGLAGSRDPNLRRLAGEEFRAASAALDRFEGRWRHGGSAVLRPLVDSGVIDLLSGPLAHPFQPLLTERFLDAALTEGLADTHSRIGPRPGIWAPECGYRPGLAAHYASAGVQYLMVEGPTMAAVGAHTSHGHALEDTDVIAFGRDLDVTYRVWSPTQGYPRGEHYRDFHTYEHEFGFHPARVTGRSVPSDQKAPYDPVVARRDVARDARDFVDHVIGRLAQIEARDGAPGLVVAGFDTELFGHWWYEGPQWLDQVLTLLPEAGVEVTTLDRARDRYVAERIWPRHGSWGAGKHFETWAGDQVASIVADNDRLQAETLRVLDAQLPSARQARSAVLDQLARSSMLALSSDWAFMVTKDSAAEYAWRRHFCHHSDVHRLLRAIDEEGLESAAAHQEAAEQRAINGPFGGLDGRSLYAPTTPAQADSPSFSTLSEPAAAR